LTSITKLRAATYNLPVITVTNFLDDPRLLIAIVEVANGEVRPASDQLRQEAHTVCAPLLAPDYELPEATRKAVRGALKVGGFSPTGRSKPASEYLLADLRERGSFNHISGPVDVNNVVSLETVLPISLLDGSKFGGAATVRIGGEGEGYVFNNAGQWLDVKRCIVTCAGAAPGLPLGTPVKDSMAGKVFDGCTHFLGVIYGASELYAHDALWQVAQRMADLLARETGGEIVQVSVL
jgi:DNA/RNA-binding domain of Phe-tRNA-synthetase-like protein